MSTFTEPYTTIILRLRLIFRPDRTLQDIVYKIVPGIYHGKHESEFFKYYFRFVFDTSLHRSLCDSEGNNS